MEMKRYHSRRTELEYEAVQITPENIQEVAEHFSLEYVKEHINDDCLVEQALFRPGYNVPVHVGDFVVQPMNTEQQAYAVLAADFDYYYVEIVPHPFVPQVFYSDGLYEIPCVFCGNTKDGVPYHRDGIPGEVLKLPDGGTLRIIVK